MLFKLPPSSSIRFFFWSNIGCNIFCLDFLFITKPVVIFECACLFDDTLVQTRPIPAYCAPRRVTLYFGSAFKSTPSLEPVSGVTSCVSFGRESRTYVQLCEGGALRLRYPVAHSCFAFLEVIYLCFIACASYYRVSCSCCSL